MRTVRPLGVGTSVLALGMMFWLSGCSGPAEVAKPAAPPVQVKWNSSEGSPASEEAPAGRGDDKISTSPQEIDLDAPPPEKAPHKEEKPAHKEEPKPAPPPEPPAEPAPPAPSPEAEAEPAPAPPPEAPAVEPTTPLGKEIRAAVKSKEKPVPPSKSASKKRAAAAPPPAAAAAYTGPNPCKTTRFSVPRVKEACENGGRQAAKGVMKEAVSKALAAGASLKCGDCHAEQKDYTLKKDAVAKLKKWLGP